MFFIVLLWLLLLFLLLASSLSLTFQRIQMIQEASSWRESALGSGYPNGKFVRFSIRHGTEKYLRRRRNSYVARIRRKNRDTKPDSTSSESVQHFRGGGGGGASFSSSLLSMSVRKCATLATYMSWQHKKQKGQHLRKTLVKEQIGQQKVGEWALTCGRSERSLSETVGVEPTRGSSLSSLPIGGSEKWGQVTSRPLTKIKNTRCLRIVVGDENRVR